MHPAQVTAALTGDEFDAKEALSMKLVAQVSPLAKAEAAGQTRR